MSTFSQKKTNLRKIIKIKKNMHNLFFERESAIYFSDISSVSRSFFFLSLEYFFLLYF